MGPEKVFDLLEQWNDLRGQGRQIGVEELCRECPELAGKVARLVRAVEATDWLEERCEDVGAVCRALASPEELGLPGKVGRYELGELIGEGGFGYVFRGYDPELRRHIAVKVARPSRTTSQEQTERFLEEARRAAQLKHPGIVPVHDVGRDGRWIYIVSDLVEGCDLGTAARHRRLTAAESARIGADVADALQAAHRKGLVHRDVKPANILLDREGHVYLSDFGIAVTQEQLQGGAVPGEGTLAYMAPEQLAATGGRVGPQSDVYSLGVVLYELLTERRPPRGTDSPLRSQEPVGLEKPSGGKSNGVPPPSTLDPSVPARLDAVCLRALAESPADRFSSAAEFAQAIRSAVTDNRRRRIVLWLAGLASVLLVSVAALIVGQKVWRRQPSPPPAEEDVQVPHVDAGGPPVAGAMYFAGHHYKYIRAQVDWHEAQRRCEEMGGSLAMIKSQREQGFIAKMLEREPAYVYIGLTDEGHEGDWRWVDGSPAEFTNWARGEPKHSGEVEHWVAVNPFARSAWVDIAVGHYCVTGFVCQWGGKPAPHYSAPPLPANLRPEDYRPGLVAEFFNDTAFRQRVASRIDPNIDFQWGASRPHPELHSDHFGIRWRGYLKLPKAGQYSITVKSCNGARVVLDGWVIIEQLVTEKECRFVCKLLHEAAGYHALQIEFAHSVHPAYCHVSWEQDKGFPEKIIGPECLFHDAEQERRAGVK